MRKACMAVLVLAVCVLPSRADVRTRAATEAAEFLLAKFGSRAVRSVPVVAQKIEGLVARHGDVAIQAIRKGGPNGIHLVEAAGPNAGKAIAVLVAHGEVGAARVLSRPVAMNQVVRYGEQAAAVLCRHPGVAEGFIEKGGMRAVQALDKVTVRNGRRLAILAENDFAKLGKHPELLDVVAKHGDPAAAFLWKNKEVLAGGAALSAFLLNPEPFLSGARDITKAAGDGVVAPVVKGISTAVNILLVALAVLVGGLLFLVFHYGLPDLGKVKEWRLLMHRSPN